MLAESTTQDRFTVFFKARFVAYVAVVGALFALFSPPAVQAQGPSVEQALGLRPTQVDVDYSKPDKEAAASCTLTSAQGDDATGWIVRDGSGRLLRRFLDTNGDNKIDLWSYYKDGIEVYRDMDTNFNNKADQVRWLGTAGTRWGFDNDENGVVDMWQVISPEEVTSEIVQALKLKKPERFLPLMLTPKEVETLGLGAERKKQLLARINDLATRYKKEIENQKEVDADTEWVHFGSGRPGTIPTGTEGSTKDLTVYENVVAVTSSSGTGGQVPVGTLVKIGDAWRVINLPLASGAGDEQTACFFFTVEALRPEALSAGGGVGMDHLVKQLNEVDTKLANPATTAKEKPALHATRAQVLQQLSDIAATTKERDDWLRQMVDSIDSAVQSGEYPNGLSEMEKIYNRLHAKGDRIELAGYVRYRWMTSDYHRSFQAPDSDYTKIQAKWLKDLEQYIKDFPDNAQRADAMLQLALLNEDAGEDAKAAAWYRQIATRFPDTTMAGKATGAMKRIGSVGKPHSLKGTTAAGQALDTSSFQGKLLLVHYWASWSEPCRNDMATLLKLQKTYGPKGFAIVGVNLDGKANFKALQAYLTKTQLSWHQLIESGGMDGPLARDMGVFRLPTMLLIDPKGRVLNRGIHIGQVEEELKKRL